YKAELIITHIIDIKQFTDIRAYHINVAAQAEEYGKEILSNYEDVAKNSGIENVKTVLEFGSPKIKISKDVAPKHNVDLIICGATGLSAVERFLIGSVSESITRYSKCDVMVVRTEKDL